MSTPVTPIADLTYRNYDGPLDSPQMRWWVIARMSVRAAFKKKSFWVFTTLSGAYYFVMMIVLFFVEQMAPASAGGGPNPMTAFYDRLVWKDQFLHGISLGQIWFLVLALLVGAGSIANDNRANALLVYLSKPCEKLDYIIGKWVGIFLPLLLATALPTMFFYAYGAMSFREYGFLSSDPWLIVKLLFIIPLPAAFHASLVLGVSSMFNQGRLAGATYAGLYFVTNFFTQLMGVTWRMSHGSVSPVIKNLYYGSVDGMQIGLTKAILGTDGSPPFGAPGRFSSVPAPTVWLFALLYVVICAASIAFAWRRIRAVEIVG